MTSKLWGPWVGVLCATLAACSDGVVAKGGDDDVDADVGADDDDPLVPDAGAAVDAGDDDAPLLDVDAAPDGAIDAVPDAAVDAGIDAPVDAAPRVWVIDPRRSLAITEQPILARFSLQRVMEQLAARSQVAGLTSTSLFQQWWDTQNPRPGMTAGPHCDDTVDPMMGPVLNGYPYDCRPAPSEGAGASCDPYGSDMSDCAYMPIGLFNRFDLAPTDGAHCGEYRIAYAKRTGAGSSSDRTFVIFEAILPNPHPEQGLAGCRPIAELWGELSTMSDLEARAAALEAFYFEGSAELPPVVDAAHFGANAQGAGQIRTNQFSNLAPWTLREYKIRRDCAAGRCSAMRVAPVSDKTNPYGPLFAPDNMSPTAQDFRSVFLTQVATLAGPSLTSIGMAIPDRFNSGQSQATGMTEESNYVNNFGRGGDLRAAIADQLAQLGSPLTPDHIIARAQTQSCAGCHHFSNGADLGRGLRWPSSLGFNHVSERDTEMVGGATRYLLSPAMVQVFLPHRRRVLEDYLNGRAPAVRALLSVGGATTH
jgi:hypothetical protein